MRFAFVLTSPGEVERKEQSTPFKTMLDDDGKRCHDCQIPHAMLQSPGGVNTKVNHMVICF